MSNKKHILIGNGFNIALSELKGVKTNKLNQSFLSYETIINAIQTRLGKNKGNQSTLHRLVEKIKSINFYNIENLLYILSQHDVFNKILDGIYINFKANSKDKINNDINDLRSIMKEVISDPDIHPKWEDLFNISTQDCLHRCRSNIATFDRVFTTNYDLILYWVLMEDTIIKGFRDGFCLNGPHENLLQYKSNYSRANILYLHGAIHILTKGQTPYKLRKDKDNPLKNLCDIQKALSDKLIEYESSVNFCETSLKKSENIIKNEYAIMGYRKLETIKGNLIIYGIKPYGDSSNRINNEVDEHIWRNIMYSNISNIYIGISGNKSKNLEESEKKISKALKNNLRLGLDNKICIRCFSSERCNIWKNNNFYKNVIKNSSKGSLI